jgi:hypothetical protein
VRDLRVVGVSDDGRHLVLAGLSELAGEFRIPIDARLRSAVRGHLDDSRLELRDEEPPTPRAIQARIRAGASVAELAQWSGLPLDRLTAYAHPVLAERSQVVQEARSARIGDDGTPLGELVDGRLFGQDIDLDEAEWDAWRGPDGRWTVQLVYPAHGRLQVASWRWDPASRRVAAADAPAESLLRGGPATHGAASIAARQAALFGAPTIPTPPPPNALPYDAPAGITGPDDTAGRAETAASDLVAPVGPAGRARRASVPSWTQIRETARMPSAPSADPAE